MLLKEYYNLLISSTILFSYPNLESSNPSQNWTWQLFGLIFEMLKVVPKPKVSLIDVST